MRLIKVKAKDNLDRAIHKLQDSGRNLSRRTSSDIKDSHQKVIYDNRNAGGSLGGSKSPSTERTYLISTKTPSTGSRSIFTKSNACKDSISSGNEPITV